MKTIFLSITFFCSISILNAQIIHTVAGGKNFGDGGNGLNALVGSPMGVTTDSSGNIYFCGSYNVIRKITKATGIVSHIAGTIGGFGGFAGDGGPATAATLNYAVGTSNNIMVVNRHNNDIYLTDAGNHRVRKIDGTTGIITTIAGTGIQGNSGDGGPAIAAMLSVPQSIALDDSGNIYISDSYNKFIRKISASTGYISTIAGLSSGSGYTGDNGPATAAKIEASGGIVIDNARNVIFASKFNAVIRKITVSTGIVTTIAGTGSVGSSGDGGPATNAHLDSPMGLALDTTGNMYFSVGFKIRMVNASNNIISTFAGSNNYIYNGEAVPGLQAAFTPYGIAIDRYNNLYLADNNNHRIRQLAISDTIINTIAGNGTPGFLGDGIPANQSSLFRPNAVTLDTAGNMYIADGDNYRIRKVTRSTGLISTVTGNGTNLMTGEDIPAINAGIGLVRSVVLDNLSNIYLAEVQNYRVRKINVSNGHITTFAGSDGSALGDGGPAINATLQPDYMAFDTSGNLYISDFYNRRIREITKSDGFIHTIAGLGGSGAYLGDGGPAVNAYLSIMGTVFVDSAANVYLHDSYRMRKITRQTGIIDRIAGNGSVGHSPDGTLATNAMLRGPSAIAMDRQGNIIFADDNSIRKLTVATGLLSTISGANNIAGYSGDSSLAMNANMNYPNSIYLDKYGDMYVSEYYNNCIRKITMPVTSVNNGFWNDPATWSNGKIPDAFTQVSVVNNVIVNVNAFAYSVNLTGMGSLNVNAGLNLNITGH